MEQFKDANGYEVVLSFNLNAFGREPDHVLVLCKYQESWLLTDHKLRGWEFPGGKKENGETLEQSAAREVYEETGGIVSKLSFVGEYQVSSEGPVGSFIKRIYYAEVDNINPRNDYLETNGPVIESGDILAERIKPHYSFIMKDDVVRMCLLHLEAARR
jgi:8-oxo-dGTP diphosphatase